MIKLHREVESPYDFTFSFYRTCLVAQTIKNLPAIQETRVWFLCQEDPLEKGMAPHSSVLAWQIPRTEEPGGLQSMQSQRVGHHWATNTAASSMTQLVKNPSAVPEVQVRSLGWEDPQRSKWQSNPVFLPEKSHGKRSLVGYSPWGCKRVRHDWVNTQPVFIRWHKMKLFFGICFNC